ncbi:response regulator transcription factor [Aliikangiella sp. G2MR2-5]|uniref:response regulator transcription factor n=1 Tax=Aliikangiella sp. G2MR2-5 TaxID=2788943 RepID=UPI0018AB716C|nr:response regulator transcription factor [Aliikangiella sp. G2MR2-5]
MSQQNKILIVEDEEAIRSGLIDVFVYHGYQVDSSADGREGLDKVLAGQYDLILLDVMLPSMNGFDICQAIREKDKAQPIIMLTAKNAEEDVIQGFSLGADDYVAKPFSVAQLVLRVKAVLRRTGKTEEAVQNIRLSAEREVDLTNLSVTAGKENIALTKREAEVIQYLFVNRQRPVSREELLEKVWGYSKELELETRTVDIHIAKIRRKIEVDPKEACFLLTIRGAGYKLVCEVR